MSELTDFLNKLSACSLIVLTAASEERLYCRFFLNGVYMDGMFVSAPALVAQLRQLQGEGEEIDSRGIVLLKQLHGVPVS
ncbi:hypothetical protein ACFSRY_18780 [Pontibacter locisalis]|uniref:Uncharacterized protein n=1 Tax=Pontibacter locisalis TaxID=1719035 RepID=A0ABW5IQJ2_9BACT